MIFRFHFLTFPFHLFFPKYWICTDGDVSNRGVLLCSVVIKPFLSRITPLPLNVIEVNINLKKTVSPRSHSSHFLFIIEVSLRTSALHCPISIFATRKKKRERKEDRIFCFVQCGGMRRLSAVNGVFAQRCAAHSSEAYGIWSWSSWPISVVTLQLIRSRRFRCVCCCCFSICFKLPLVIVCPCLALLACCSSPNIFLQSGGKVFVPAPRAAVVSPRDSSDKWCDL